MLSGFKSSLINNFIRVFELLPLRSGGIALSIEPVEEKRHVQLQVIVKLIIY